MSQFINSDLNKVHEQQSFLSESQVASFNNDGYLVLNDFWSLETVKMLRDRIDEIVKGFDFDTPRSPGFPKAVFSTKEQCRTSDDYFLNSGYAIRFFWEENAWIDDKLVHPPEVCINKVGHALHDMDPKFEAVTYEPRIGQICRDLGLVKPLAAQSMYIFKQAYIGGEVNAHQDGAFLYTEPQSVIGFWWALDDCTESNGCLWAVPGSHRMGVSRRFRRVDPPGEGTEFVPSDPVMFSKEGAVSLEVRKGSLVLLHSALVHYSAENSSPNARHAYSAHIIEGADSTLYPSDNWLQRPSDHPFRVVP